MEITGIKISTARQTELEDQFIGIEFRIRKPIQIFTYDTIEESHQVIARDSSDNTYLIPYYAFEKKFGKKHCKLGNYYRISGRVQVLGGNEYEIYSVKSLRRVKKPLGSKAL